MLLWLFNKYMKNFVKLYDFKQQMVLYIVEYENQYSKKSSYLKIY